MCEKHVAAIALVPHRKAGRNGEVRGWRGGVESALASQSCTNKLIQLMQAISKHSI